MHQGTSLSLYLRCLLMVLEINKAIMYLKIRSSFTITKKKKKRQNTPNLPELGGMTQIQITNSKYYNSLTLSFFVDLNQETCMLYSIQWQP